MKPHITVAAVVGVAALAFLVSPPTPLVRRFFYPGRRPSRFAKAINAGWSWLASSGLLPEKWPGKPVIGSVTVETRGRKSGLPRSNMVTWVEYEGDRYLVSMLGEHTAWVRNARAASGEAVLRRGKRTPVTLEDVPVDQRAPIIRDWYRRTASSTRAHVGLDTDAPLEEFERIANRHPVFRIVRHSRS
jgi:deazaflavin-dependent oxidoreductase (nitroreductase family)